MTGCIPGARTPSPRFFVGRTQRVARGAVPPHDLVDIETSNEVGYPVFPTSCMAFRGGFLPW